MTTEAIMELGREFPSLLEPLIYERDRYMVRPPPLPPLPFPRATPIRNSSAVLRHRLR